MLREGRKEENAGVSNSNKSSNAERFLPVLSWSVDSILSLKTGLCLVALAVGRRVQCGDYPLHSSPREGAVCPGGASVSTSAGLLEDTSQQHRGLWPQLDLRPATHIHRAEGNQWINWHETVTRLRWMITGLILIHLFMGQWWVRS